MRIAALQMTTTPEPASNLRQARELLEEAIDKGSELVAFPEMFYFLSPHARAFIKHAQNPLIIETLKEWAIEHEVWILGGSIAFKQPQTKKLLNLSLLINPDGKIQARYAKIHLFDAQVASLKDPKRTESYKESSLFDPGKKITTSKITSSVTGEMFHIGLSICYDLRFPELYRKMSQKNAPEILFIPSAFTLPTGQAHWDVLTRARAIENQAYVIAPAQSGLLYPDRECYGHTRIIDPWGKIIAERPVGPGVVWADISLNQTQEVRKRIPALRHRVLD